ncbi:NTP pyrophosphatase (non-canonical NTP hydrolase) [Streptococcus rupicaprae]|uniref:NTP pyrophosphatase (Non-canonical NTP hydrolase) n=1 Tax=Streptococcus rupicaprae TaxID=759619 RepID=A0ABV2FJB9_9STRE
MNYEELTKKIEAWSEERGLHQADPKIQWMRVTEEVGEIRDVLLKPGKFENPDHAIKDAVGDSLVTIIVLAQQLGLDTVECLEEAYNEIKNRSGQMVNGTYVKSEDLEETKLGVLAQRRILPKIGDLGVQYLQNSEVEGFEGWEVLGWGTENAYKCTEEEAKKYPGYQWVPLEKLEKSQC